jgi:type II secretion system protein G
LLAFVMATAPSASVIAQTNATQPPARQGAQDRGTPAVRQADQAPSGDRLDLTYVSPRATVLAVLRPAQIMSSPAAELLPKEIATAAGLKYLGFDPAHVDEVIAFVEQINPMAPPAYGFIMKFNTPFRGSSIAPAIRAHTQMGELAGRRYLQSQNPELPSFYGPNNTTLVVAPDATLRQLIESADEPKAGPLVDRAKGVSAGNDLYAAVDVASLRPLILMGLAQAQADIPPDVQPFLEAPHLISAAELTFNLSGAPMSFVVHADDEADAQKLVSLIADANKKYQERMREAFAEQAASADPVEQATARYMERISGRWLKPFMPERDGASLTFFKTEGTATADQQLTNVAVIGFLMALLLPAIQAAREAARRNQSINNIKQVLLALLMHLGAKGSYPAYASYRTDGKPLLSWRVHILPYLEEQALYEQFRLDEPWDSEHNRALIVRMPAVFQNPNLPDQTGKTNYLAVVGEACIFDGTQEGTKIREVTDGTADTVMVVEAAREQAVEWTKPDDWEFNPANPTAGLGGIRPGGWLAGFADGSVHFISEDLNAEQVKAMFTSAAGDQTAERESAATVPAVRSPRIGAPEAAHRNAAKAQVGLFNSAAKLYRFHNRKFPTSLSDLSTAPSDAALKERWAGPYIDRIAVDPWGDEYKYVAPGKRNPNEFDVWSVGPDGQDGTSDDIGNWQ